MNDIPLDASRSDSRPPLAPALLEEVSVLLSEIAYDRIHTDIRPEGTEVDPGWLREAAAEQYGLLGAALDERDSRP